MIEATCTACGTVNRIADADVPIGARFVNCASCKSRVAIAGKPAASKPAPVDVADLADLPAPRRHSALGGEPAKPAPRSALTAADTHMEPELPAPRTKRTSSSPLVVPAGTSLELDELLGPSDAPLELADLPAPRAKSPGADLPMPRPKQPAGIVDLPAPRGKPGGVVDLPAPRPNVGRAMTDLPIAEATPPPMPALPAAPKLPALDDLPRPKPAVAAGPLDLPAPRAKAAAPDLPAPRPKQPAGVVDLPAPRRTPPIGIPEVRAKPHAAAMTLPSPGALKPPAAPARPPAIADLPQPRPVIADLPQPKAGVVDLPAPKPGADLPAPKGFFEDLPQPATASRQAAAATDVAPKGFFDDLPQPAAASRQAAVTTDVAPKGFFEDLPQPAAASRQSAAATDVAPKGFFDDLPQPARDGGGSTDVAPQGFFDDLPGRPTKQSTDVAPKGFFDDLPGRPTKQNTDVAPKGFFDDLPQPGRAPAASPPPPPPAASLDLEPIEASQPGIELDFGASIELEDTQAAPQPRTKAPSVVPAPVPGPSNQFDDLDLSAPSPVRFEAKPKGASGAPPSSVATVRTPMAPLAPVSTKGDISLELEEPRHAPAPTLAAKPDAKAKATAKAPVDPAAAKRRTKIVAIAAAGVLALGGGGFVMYQRHAKAEAHAAQVAEQVGAARRALANGQWSRANTAAQQTLELDGTNAEALGIAAEALFAAGIHDGSTPRIAQGRKLLAKALEANAKHPTLERAQALSPIAAGQPEAAIAKLQALAARAPADGPLALYLGWAHAARGDHDAALAALDKAVAVAAVKIPALFARARVKQAKGDLAGAQADFAGVLEVQKDNIPAQVGLASALPAGKAPQQEADLLAILAIKDLGTREPRAATQAWALAADVARRSGKLDVARERYRKALAISPQDVDTLIGLGEVELRDGKLDLAADALGKVLQQAPDNMRAQLAATEIALAQKKYGDAETRIQALSARTPPPPAVEQARLKMLAAELLERKGQEDAAITAYLDAARLAGDLDLTPTLTAAAKLNQLAAKAADPARANELRAQAEQLLATLADNAKQDAQAALTLGTAYLQAGDAAKAEPWLRQVIEQRPNDADAQHQLAKALAALGKSDDAIERLRKAMELDPARIDIGLELARTYEATRRTDDAARLYGKLVATAEPPVVLRERAGRFFARIGDMAKAGEQGAKILEVNPDHPAGLYLKGEGLLAAGKTDEARRLFTVASDAGEAQYLDALGRAAEKWAKESGDSKYVDTALRAYTQATEQDPAMHTSLVGQGRLYVQRREDVKAIPPLAAAAKLRMTAEIGYLMGVAYKNLGQPATALQWLVAADKLAPTADSAYLLAEIYNSAEINKPPLAAAAIATATRLAEEREKKTGETVPWLTDALYLEGDLNRALGRDAQARRAWEKFLARKPPPGARVKEAQHFLATTLQR